MMGRAPTRQSFEPRAFARDVYAAARRKGLGIEELENRVGVTANFVSRIHLYNRRPNVDAFLNLCWVLDLDPMAYRAPEKTATKPRNSVFDVPNEA